MSSDLALPVSSELWWGERQVPCSVLTLISGVLGPITAWGYPIEGMGAGQEWYPRLACHLGGWAPGRVATILQLCYLCCLGKSLEALPDSPVSGGENGRGLWPTAQPPGGQAGQPNTGCTLVGTGLLLLAAISYPREIPGWWQFIGDKGQAQ